MLIAFIVTFAATRTVTRRIRAGGSGSPHGRNLLKDISIGGVHVHHQIWGLLLVLVSALLEFAYRPGTPWLEVLGAAFGAGAALILDEFALSLHLQDVYWAEEGQKSIDAVVLGACLCGVLLVGTTPLGYNDASDAGLGSAAITVLVNGCFSLVAFLKGKLVTGAIGIFVPVVGFVGAVRLARPGSPWARWRYRRNPRKMERAVRRFTRYDARWARFRSALGGAPTPG
jgi:hypothetical protein